MISNSERARKTAEKLAENYWIPPFEPDKLFLERKVKVKKEIAQIVLSALNEAVKELGDYLNDNCDQMCSECMEEVNRRLDEFDFLATEGRPPTADEVRGILKD